MKIITLPVGEMGTNCYLAIDEDTQETLIIDPGDEADFISTSILENKLKPIAIVLTHGHYDHCLANLELKLNFNLPIYLHKDDLFLYQRATSTANHFSQPNHVIPAKAGIHKSTHSILKQPLITNFLENNQVLTFGNSALKVLHTPGHTPGSVCLSSFRDSYSIQDNLILFTGDTLFSDSVGSTEHNYSSKSDLKSSLKLLSNLPKETKIYPGHGDTETPGFLRNQIWNILPDVNIFQ